MTRGPALGVVESSSVARGVVVADAALKRSPALLVHSRATSGGKHLTILEGGVAEIDEAMAAARAAAGDRIVDSVLLPAADDQVWPMLGAPVDGSGWEGDAAVKMADVIVRDVRFAVDLAGKAYFTLTGDLDAIQASSGAARDAAGDRLVELEVIAQPAPELRGRLFR